MNEYGSGDPTGALAAREAQSAADEGVEMYSIVYGTVVRGPRFRGRHRIENWLRARLAPRSQPVAGDVRMVLDPLEWLQVELMSGEAPEPVTSALVRRLLQPGDTFVDIGAHVGWLTLQAARIVGPTGMVVAVDPQPYNCEKLLTNAHANGLTNITVVCGAAGERTGHVRLMQQNMTDKARLTLSGSGVNDTRLPFITQIWTLPDLFEMLGLTKVNLLKVDVEGYEREVFRAAGADLMARVDNIIFESLEDDPAAAEVRAMVADGGFGLSAVDGTPIDDNHLPERNVWAVRGRA